MPASGCGRYSPTLTVPRDDGVLREFTIRPARRRRVAFAEAPTVGFKTSGTSPETTAVMELLRLLRPDICFIGHRRSGSVRRVRRDRHLGSAITSFPERRRRLPRACCGGAFIAGACRPSLRPWRWSSPRCSFLRRIHRHRSARAANLRRGLARLSVPLRVLPLLAGRASAAFPAGVSGGVAATFSGAGRGSFVDLWTFNLNLRTSVAIPSSVFAITGRVWSCTSR